MKRLILIPGLMVFLLISSLSVNGNEVYSNQNETPPAFRLIKTIRLPMDVHGRIDHLSIDLKSQQLFIAALGNKSVLVLNLNTGKVVHRITHLDYPQGVLFIPGSNKLFVSTAGDGKLQIYNAQTFQLQKVIDFKDDADNLRYDGRRKLVYVGYGSGGIGVVNVVNNSLVRKIVLPAHAEAFSFASEDTLMYVNVPDANQMDIINRNTFRVIGKKHFHKYVGNFPLTLDRKGHRLFIGFRAPPILKIYSTNTIESIGSLKISRDIDDLYYNPKKEEIYISCGGGYVEIIKALGPKKYVLEEKIKTRVGARTSLFVPETSTFYLAAPKSGNSPAQIFIYRVH